MEAFIYVCADYEATLSPPCSTFPSAPSLGLMMTPALHPFFFLQQLLQAQLLAPSPLSSLPLLRLTVPPDPSDGWLSTRGF